MDSSLVESVTLFDRKGGRIEDAISRAGLIWSSLTPDLVQVDQVTGRMAGLNSGVGRVVVSLQDINLSDTITVLVIAVAVPPSPIPNLPDRNAVVVLVDQCFEGMADWTEEELRTRLGGGDPEVLSSILVQLNRELRFEGIEIQEPTVRRSEREAYSNVRVRLSWSTELGPRESLVYQIVANATWDGAGWLSSSCSVWP